MGNQVISPSKVFDCRPKVKGPEPYNLSQINQAILRFSNTTSPQEVNISIYSMQKTEARETIEIPKHISNQTLSLAGC